MYPAGMRINQRMNMAPDARPRRRAPGLFILGLLLLAAPWLTALPAPQKSKSETARLFAYDRSKPFDLKESSRQARDGVTYRDVNYAAHNPPHLRIQAYLITPDGNGPFAGVVFFHWLGRPDGDRREFLREATALAKQGVVALLIQGYFPALEPPTDALVDRRRVIEQTIEVRRALDLLLAQPNVDAQRIAYVGHDYGAMYGAVVAGVEKRVKAYVLMAGTGSFSDWSLKYWAATRARGEQFYRLTMSAVDPLRHVANAAPAALLFQFANTDEFITKETATAFFNRASDPKQIEWYDAEHDLNLDAARNDRRAWLARQLGLAKSEKVQ